MEFCSSDRQTPLSHTDGDRHGKWRRQGKNFPVVFGGNGNELAKKISN